MNRIAWAAVALALRWANATDDQAAYPVLERVEAEPWKLNHPRQERK